MRISVVVPARNEAANLLPVLQHARAYADELWVVDGHSTDETRALALQAGARVVLDNRRGKGDAIRVGIAHATGDIVVFIDADCSHNPHDIPALVAPIREGRAEIVVASRMLGGSEELHGDLPKLIRRFGSDIITLGINWRYGVAITDSQNGFRALRADVARNLSLEEDITTIEQEMLIKALSQGHRVLEVPSREYKRRSGQSCIHVPKVAWRYVWSWASQLAHHAPPPGMFGHAWHPYANTHPWWVEPPPASAEVETASVGAVGSGIPARPEGALEPPRAGVAPPETPGAEGDASYAHHAP